MKEMMGCLVTKSANDNELDKIIDNDEQEKIHIPIHHPLEGIVAMDCKGGIGKNGTMAWKIREEMEFFKKMTIGHIIIMGSSTFESLQHKLLPNRLNIVLTNNFEKYSKMYAYSNLLFVDDTNIYYKLLNENDILERYPFLKIDYKVFVIGGAGIYRILIPECSCIWSSVIDKKYDCDVYFPCCELINDRKKYIKEIYQSYKDFVIYKHTKRKIKQ